MTRQQSLKQRIISCNRRLNVLEEKRSYQGGEVAPHILMEIEDTKAELKMLRDELRQLETESDTAAPIEKTGQDDNPITTSPPLDDPPQPPQSVGHQFDVSIGDDNKNIAIGENVSIVTEATAVPTNYDREVINNHLENLRRMLNQLSHLDQKQQILAEDRLDTLVTEFTKINEGPNPHSIRQAAEWLLDNVPDLTSALGALCNSPITTRLLSRAGQETLAGLKARFGNK